VIYDGLRAISLKHGEGSFLIGKSGISPP